jgi:hypothetical protein
MPSDGSPRVDVTDDRDAVVGEVEQLHGDDPEQDRNQRGGHRRCVALEGEHHDQRSHADYDSVAADVVELSDEVPEPLEEVALAAAHAHELGQLADDDRQRHADDEPLEDWLGDEVRMPTPRGRARPTP